MNIFVFLRLLIGILFIFSGGQKLIEPYQNFQFDIEHYQLFDFLSDSIAHHLNAMIAKIIPWVELFLGLFLVLGLWLKNNLTVVGLLFFSFITIISQALWRGLPIDECGCFGENINIPPQMTLVMDLSFLIIVFILKKNLTKVKQASLDLWFDKK